MMSVDQVDLHRSPADHERGDDSRHHFRHALFTLGHLLAGRVLAEHLNDQTVQNRDDYQRHNQPEDGEAVSGDMSGGVKNWIVLAKQAHANVGERINK